MGRDSAALGDCNVTVACVGGNNNERGEGTVVVRGANRFVRGDSQGCQMAKFDPFLSLDCARVEGVGEQSKERKGSNFAA